MQRGEQLAGRYELVEKIGEGGMGEVWRGKQVALGREVAIKVIHPRGSDVQSMRDRFKREAELVARVAHRNVIDIIEFGTTEDDSQFLVMPFLRGESLEDRLVREPPPSLEELLHWTRSILGGLGAIHDKGIVHRDLKPANVFLAEDADGVVPKLLDFGISRADGAEDAALTGLTQQGTALGTPRYMAPEQFESARDVDLRADLYSVGVLLYETLTGRLPFAGQDAFSIYRAILQTEAVPLAKLRPELPSELHQFVHRALSKDRDARFASARDMREALDGIVVAGTIKGVSAKGVVGAGTPLAKPGIGTAPTQPLLDTDPLAQTMMAGEAPTMPPTMSSTMASAPKVPSNKRWLMPLVGVALLGAVGGFFVLRPNAPIVSATSQRPIEQPPVIAEPDAASPAVAEVAETGLLLGRSTDLNLLAMRWAYLSPNARPEIRLVAQGDQWLAVAPSTTLTEVATRFAAAGDTTPESIPWDPQAGLTPSFVRTRVRLNIHVGPDIESETKRVVAHDTLAIALYGEQAGHLSAAGEDAVTFFVVSRNDSGWVRSHFLELNEGCMPSPGALLRAAGQSAGAIRRDQVASRTTANVGGTRHDAFLLAARDARSGRSYVGLFQARGDCRVREVLAMHVIDGVVDEYFLTDTAPHGGETLLAISSHPNARPPSSGMLAWQIFRSGEDSSVWRMDVPTAAFLGRRGGAVNGSRDRGLRGRPGEMLSVRERTGAPVFFRWHEGRLVEAN